MPNKKYSFALFNNCILKLYIGYVYLFKNQTQLQAQRNEQEDRVNTLESRILTAQREAACQRDLCDKLQFQVD